MEILHTVDLFLELYNQVLAAICQTWGIMESTSSSKGTIGDKRVVAALIASVTGSGRDALLSLPMPGRIRDMAFIGGQKG